MKKIALIDFDETLVQIDTLDELCSMTGHKEDSKHLNELFLNKKREGSTVLSERINFLAGTHLSDINSHLDTGNYLTRGASELVNYLKTNNFITVLHSGNIEPVLHYYQAKLNIDYIVCNTPDIVNNTIIGIEESKLNNKYVGCRHLLNKLGISSSDLIVAIGDSNSDFPIFEMANCKIAINPKNGIQEKSDLVICESLCEAIDFLKVVDEKAIYRYGQKSENQIVPSSLYNSIIKKLNTDYCAIYLWDTGLFHICKYNDILPIVDANIEKLYNLYLPSDAIDLVKLKSITPDSISLDVMTSPLEIGVMLTNQCNLNCKYCISRNGGSYSQVDEFNNYKDKLLNEIADYNISSVMFAGGEPTLYNNIVSLLNSTNGHPYLCLLDTNGVYFSSDVLAAIKNNNIIPRVSLDSEKCEVNNCCRGEYGKVIDTLNNMQQNNINYRINTVVTSSNINELDSLAAWLVSKKITLWHIYKLQEEFATKELKVNDIDFDKAINKIKEKYKDILTIVCKYENGMNKYSSFMIDPAGNCFSTDNRPSPSFEKILFGNIKENNLKEIWDNAPKDFRRRHYQKLCYSH